MKKKDFAWKKAFYDIFDIQIVRPCSRDFCAQGGVHQKKSYFLFDFLLVETRDIQIGKTREGTWKCGKEKVSRDSRRGNFYFVGSRKRKANLIRYLKRVEKHKKKSHWEIDNDVEVKLIIDKRFCLLWNANKI